MGLFTQKPDDPGPWASLPGEPLDQDAADTLDGAAAVDPLEVGMGAQTTSIVFPVAPVLEEGAEQTDGEPES
ncbi:hypothetical protein [Microbacterium sp. TWP3-1-2b2]|uniref:hypothetical protein n=1 Tax=Microbacterium sp. TWP3-1-2b2 TaxID=2804651 RepID=UPI003CF6EB6D